MPRQNAEAAVAQVLVIQPVGRLADSLGRRSLIVIGTALGAGASVLLAVTDSEARFLLGMAP